MIQIQKEMPRQRQGQSSVQSWWDYYRPFIQSILSHPQDVASFTVIAAMIEYPAESYSLVQNITASDFTSALTKQLGRGCLFELNSYGSVRTENMFGSLVSDSWTHQTLGIYQWEFDQVLFQPNLEIIIEVTRGAVKELKHERLCTNRRFK